VIVTSVGNAISAVIVVSRDASDISQQSRIC
jgi:hypothetical protein